MTKRAREDVEKLLEDIAWKLRIAGVPEQQINVCHGPKYRVDHFVKAFDWLHEFTLSDAMKQWDIERGRVCEEQWERYDLLDIVGLQEQILLQKASSALLKRWKVKRPRMFGPDREVQNAQDNGSNVQQDQEHTSQLRVQAH